MFETIYEYVTNSLGVLFYFIIPLIIVAKIFRRKKLPNNEYTPYDDILAGRTRNEEYHTETVQEDTKHETPYNEVNGNKKT